MANDDVKMTIRIHNFCACAWPDRAKMWSCLIFSFFLPESEWWRSWIFFPFSSLWGFVWWPTFYVFVVKMLGKNDHELDNYMKWNYPGLLLLWPIVSLWLYCVSVPNVPARSCWELGSSIRAGSFVVFVSVIFNLNVWQVPESICLVCTQEYIYLFISTLVFSCYFIDRFMNCGWILWREWVIGFPRCLVIWFRWPRRIRPVPYLVIVVVLFRPLFHWRIVDFLFHQMLLDIVLEVVAFQVAKTGTSFVLYVEIYFMFKVASCF